MIAVSVLANMPGEQREAMHGLRAQRCCGTGLLLASSTEARTQVREVEVFKRLLARGDRDPFTRAQLERVVGGDPLDLSDALRNLAAAGVIHLSEDSVTVTHAARWTLRLALTL